MAGVRHGQWNTGRLALALLAPALLAASPTVCAAPDAGPAVNAILAADARGFTLTAPGLMGFHGGFSARISVDGNTHVLASTDGAVVGPVRHLTEQTPYGMAEVTAATLRFANEPVEVMFRLGRVAGVVGVLAQAGIRNTSQAPVNLLSLKPVTLGGELSGEVTDWLVTNLHPNNDYLTRRVSEIGMGRNPANPADAAKAAGVGGMQLHVWENGSLYRSDGTGLLFGPVGTPIAYLNTCITHSGNGRIGLDLTVQMDGVQVDPGETRWGQQVLLLMEKPQPALERWAEWVGKTHGARTAKGALSGWSSWYFLGGDVAGKDVLEVVDGALASQDRLRPAVIQIDSGYEDLVGEKETNAKFPEGLAYYAQRIAASSARPGLQVGLITDRDAMVLIDPPKWVTISQRIHRAVQCGFSYLKLDFYGVAIDRYAEPKKTTLEVTREGFAGLRQAAGEGTYLLYCNREHDRATIGKVDASRTGVAAPREKVRAAMDDVLRSYQLNNRWFAVDNCNYYMGTDLANVSEIAGGWPLVRTWMSMVGLSCGTAITSDPWQWDSFKPYWRNVEAMQPPAKERTAVLDLGISRDWPRLVSHVMREWGNFSVALLWNPGDTERAISMDFARAGLDPNRRYAVWSFWDNRYLGVAKGEWTTPALAPSASQQLCFTELSHLPNKPVVVGSNLHIFCGAAEIQRVVSERGALRLDLTDAGARSGDLFVYSRWPLVLDAASGCVVTGIAQAGEYVWRIGLAERQRGVAQRVAFKVMLPVTQQLWFWLLIAMVVVSLVLTGWRYLVGLRLQREHALDRERARIARDMHDDLGSTLARILMLSETGGTPPPPGVGKLAKIHHAALEMTRAMDEIVWAVNPRNDRLDRLAMYLDAYAQELLDAAGVESRVDFPSPLPQRPLAAPVRHNLFLAFKEALTNLLRHAGARRVHIQLTEQSSGFVLSIEDDGRGFNPMATAAGGADDGNGLDNMQSRLAAVGGRCKVESAPGGGTRVVFEVPLIR